MKNREIYNNTLNFAAKKHNGMRYKVNGILMPYMAHLEKVAEIIINNLSDRKDLDLDLMIITSLLHDTLEDTNTTYEELEEEFGVEVSRGVSALTKNFKLDKEFQIEDSINRIKKERKEIQIVKMADRIVNISQILPEWGYKRTKQYYDDAKYIYRELNEADKTIADQFKTSIKEYKANIQEAYKNGDFLVFSKTSNGNLIVYDEKTNMTLKFSDNKWIISELLYSQISSESIITNISHSEAKEIYQNVNPMILIEELQNNIGKE